MNASQHFDARLISDATYKLGCRCDGCRAAHAAEARRYNATRAARRPRRTYVVYRCWAADGELLWIGQTVHLPTRLVGHKSRKAWWPTVAEVTSTRLTTRTAALRYERMAIRAEQPTYNFQLKGDFHGTSSRYERGCCCDACRTAGREKAKRQRARRAALLAADPTLAPHGRASTYANWLCRCDDCRQARMDQQRERRARQRWATDAPSSPTPLRGVA